MTTTENLCAYLCLCIIALYILAQCLIFGIFAFRNPDLAANNGFHCFVEPGTFSPVANQVTPSSEAFDVTAAILSVFKWQFVVNCMLLGFSGVVFTGFNKKIDSFREDGNKMLCSGILLLTSWVIGTITVDFYMRNVRY